MAYINSASSPATAGGKTKFESVWTSIQSPLHITNRLLDAEPLKNVEVVPASAAQEFRIAQFVAPVPPVCVKETF